MKSVQRAGGCRRGKSNWWKTTSNPLTDNMKIRFWRTIRIHPFWHILTIIPSAGSELLMCRMYVVCILYLMCAMHQGELTTHRFGSITRCYDVIYKVYHNPRAELLTVTIRTKSEMMRKSFCHFRFIVFFFFFILSFYPTLLFRNPFGNMNAERRKKLRHSRAARAEQTSVEWVRCRGDCG